MKLLVILHRWLGITTSLFFLLWFTSGIVMMYAEMPELSESERLEALPSLDIGRAQLSAAQAIDRAQLDEVSAIRLTSLFGRPVWRMRPPFGPWSLVFADTGELRYGFQYDEAQDSIRPFLTPGAHPRLVAALSEPDQWTLEGNFGGLKPLYHVTFDDPASTELYISSVTAEVVLRSTRRTRMLAWMGAIPHWIYLTEIRQHAAFWRQLVIWLSGTGCAVALLGLAVGIWRSIQRQGNIARRSLRDVSPFAGMMRWHHWAGLIFGILTFTWVFSGLLSMEPGEYSTGSVPTSEQSAAFSGEELDYHAFDAPPSQLLASHPLAREVQIRQVAGRPYYLIAEAGKPQQLIDGTGQPVEPFPDTFLIAAAHIAVPENAITEQVTLRDYDWYYYDRSRQRPLPVLRVKFDDPPRTWLYIDPQRGVIEARYDHSGRVTRWLYHGFHSWDFPFLYSRRPAWDILVITFCLGGILLSISGVVIGYRRLRTVLLR